VLDAGASIVLDTVNSERGRIRQSSTIVVEGSATSRDVPTHRHTASSSPRQRSSWRRRVLSVAVVILLGIVLISRRTVCHTLNHCYDVGLEHTSVWNLLFSWHANDCVWIFTRSHFSRPYTDNWLRLCHLQLHDCSQLNDKSPYIVSYAVSLPIVITHIAYKLVNLSTVLWLVVIEQLNSYIFIRYY